MNTTFILIGSYKWVLALILKLRMGHRLSIVNRTEITNYKSTTDNSIITSAIETL